MQRQGGISAPGWTLLQAIAGVHLTDAQTGSPGLQPSRWGTWVLPLLPPYSTLDSTSFLLHTYVLAHSVLDFTYST